MKQKLALVPLAMCGITATYGQEVVNTANNTFKERKSSIRFSVDNFSEYINLQKDVQSIVSITTLCKDLPEYTISLNPTSNSKSIEITLGKNIEFLQYKLFAIGGKLIAQKEISGIFSCIKMDKLPTNTYLLLITEKDKEVGSYKIVKQYCS